MAIIKCPHCGRTVSGSDNCCSYCGEKFTDDKEHSSDNGGSTHKITQFSKIVILVAIVIPVGFILLFLLIGAGLTGNGGYLDWGTAIAWLVFFLAFYEICAMIALIQSKNSDKKEAEKKKKEEEDKAYQEKVKEAQEKLQKDIEGVTGIGSYRDAKRKFYYSGQRLLLKLFSKNFYDTSRPIQRSSATWGGIANGLAGPAAGLYTAYKTEQENAAEIRRYSENMKQVSEIKKEAKVIYEELKSAFITMCKISKDALKDKSQFIQNLPSDYCSANFYNSMNLYCKGYVDSSNEDTRAYAMAFEDYSRVMQGFKEEVYKIW